MGVHASEFVTSEVINAGLSARQGCLWHFSAAFRMCRRAPEHLPASAGEFAWERGEVRPDGFTTAQPHNSTERSAARSGRAAEEDSEYGEESSYDDGMEPSVGPGIEHSGRLSPVPHDGNGMADLMTTTTSAPSPRRTRRARVPVKLEDDGTFDEEVSGRQPAKPAWSLPPVQADMAQLQPYKSDLLTKTFVQCENPECGKWRKVPVSLVDHQGRWVCAMNPDPR